MSAGEWLSMTAEESSDPVARENAQEVLDELLHLREIKRRAITFRQAYRSGATTGVTPLREALFRALDRRRS